MPKSPTCANCGQAMTETPRSQKHDGIWDVSVFECKRCSLVLFTEDHIPLTGPGDSHNVVHVRLAAPTHLPGTRRH
jgi:hypothetical protein